MKRRTILAKTPRLRDRRTGRSPYAKYRKVPYKYSTKTLNSRAADEN